jgi:hypothetical protein
MRSTLANIYCHQKTSRSPENGHKKPRNLSTRKLWHAADGKLLDECDLIWEDEKYLTISGDNMDRYLVFYCNDLIPSDEKI